jgi:uncharacterized protein DUF2613
LTVTKLIGAVAAVVIGLALATGVSFAVTSAANPDKSVDVQHAQPLDNVTYGSR